MKKDLIFVLILFTLTLATINSCATTKQSNKKCDGQKAIQTPMGKM